MRRFATGFLSIVAVFVLAGPVLAADPPTLTTTVVDQTGKLADGDARIKAAAATLKSEHDVTLYVIYLNSLDGEDPGQFIDRTAAANKLGEGRNALLLVSLTDRKDAVWASGMTAIDANELTTIRQSGVEPKLKAGDFVGAVEAAAVGFGNADAAVAAPPVVQQPSVPAKPIDLTPIGIIFAAFVVLAVALTLLYWGAKYVLDIASKRRAARVEHEKMEALGFKAHRALMQTDEQVKSAEQALAFADAEFGSDEVAPFKAALAVAQKEMQAAFAVGQLIDDETPESYDERSQMLAQILTRTEGVKAALDGQIDNVNRLHDLEANAAQTVQTLVKDRQQRAAAVVGAQTTIAALSLHGKSVVESVAPNADVAATLYATADKDLDEAQAAIDAGKMPIAALSIRRTQDSLMKAKTALDNVEKMGRVLDDAQHNLDSEIKVAAGEVAKAAAAVRSGAVAGYEDNLAVAEQTLRAAQKEASGGDADFIAAYKLAVSANDRADAILAGIRDAQEREQRAIEQAKAQVRAVEAQLAQANSYIENHRSTVGRKARTRLSEAQRQYDQATSMGDLNASLTAAILAGQLADQSYQSARGDVAASQASSGGYGSSSSSGSYSSPSHSSSSSDNSFSIGSFGGGSSSGGGFGGGGSSSSGGW